MTSMSSLFDAPEFNERLFYPRADAGPPPPGAEDLLIPVDGARLHLRRHRHRDGAPTVLLFHGNGEVVSDYDAFAPRFAAAGADLAVVDYRGYGRSEGTPSLRSVIEDAPRVVAALAAPVGRLVVMGRSLGSACAAELYRAPPAAVAGFIWESGAADLQGLVRRRGLAVPERFTEEELEVFDPLRKLRRGDRPLLVLHGAADTLIAPGEARLAWEAAGTSDKTLRLVPERGHNDLLYAAGYWEAIGRFVAALGTT